MALGDVTLTPEGVGSTFKMMGRMFLLFYMEWVLTREEYIPNERIVDHASAGGVWAYTFEPADQPAPRCPWPSGGRARCRWWAS